MKNILNGPENLVMLRHHFSAYHFNPSSVMLFSCGPSGCGGYLLPELQSQIFPKLRTLVSFTLTARYINPLSVRTHNSEAEFLFIVNLSHRKQDGIVVRTNIYFVISEIVKIRIKQINVNLLYKIPDVFIKVQKHNGNSFTTKL